MKSLELVPYEIPLQLHNFELIIVHFSDDPGAHCSASRANFCWKLIAWYFIWALP
jgi:hypothetical protein